MVTAMIGGMTAVMTATIVEMTAVMTAVMTAMIVEMIGGMTATSVEMTGATTAMIAVMTGMTVGTTGATGAEHRPLRRQRSPQPAELVRAACCQATTACPAWARMA